MSPLYIGGTKITVPNTKFYLGSTLIDQATAAAVAALPRLTKSTDGQILRSGTPWRTGGANLFHLVLNDYPNNRLMGNSEIDSLFDKCVSMNIKFVRAHTLGINIGSQNYHLVTGVSGTTTPTIAYNTAVWERMDYAIYSATQRGIYLMVPMTDELGYYHGGKRNWVNFRRPGTVSLDFNVKSANSSSQRSAEDYFYYDSQINTDFRKYISDWLNRTNQYTGRMYKDEPTIAVIETGNELWTSASYPNWNAELATYIKSVAPNVLVADGSAADGQTLIAQSLASSAIDIVGTHPYSTYNASTVTSQAQQAGNSGKAYIVGEYPWSKIEAPNVETATRNGYNIFSSAFWSLQNDADLHNNGSGYNVDDASLYYPGKDSTQTAAVSRITTHGSNLATVPAVPTPITDFGDTFDGSGALDTGKWATFLSTNSSIVKESGRAKFTTGALGGYGDVARLRSLAPAVADRGVKFDIVFNDMTEFYTRIWLRATGTNEGFDNGGNGYFIELASWGGFSLSKKVGSTTTLLVNGTSISGFAANVPVNVEFAVTGSNIVATLWTGSKITDRPMTPTVNITDTSVTAAGSFGIAVNNGNAASSRVAYVDNLEIESPGVFNIPATNLDAAWRTDSITGISNGSSVQTWPNRWGGLNLTQSDATARPTYIAASANGKPGLRFDGTNDILRSTLTFGATYSIYVVCAPTNITSTRLLVRGGIEVLFQNSRVDVLTSNTTTAGASTTTNLQLVGVTLSGANGTVQVNNNTTVNISPGNYNSFEDALAIGGRPSFDNYFVGDIQEVIFYRGILTSAELTQLKSYVKSRYGISSL